MTDAYAHCKFIGHGPDAAALFAATGLEAQIDDGFIALADGATTEQFIGRCAELRFWGPRSGPRVRRQPVGGVSAPTSRIGRRGRARRERPPFRACGITTRRPPVPVHVGGLIAITALMGEQQRSTQVAPGVARRLLPAA